MSKIVVLFTLLALITLNQRHCDAKPVLSRVKRISDQRLAELETLIALDKLKGKLITIPVGGDLNPLKIGRKRSADDALLRNLLNASEEEPAEEGGRASEEEAELEAEAESALLLRLQRLQHAQRLQRLRRFFADAAQRRPAQR